MSTNTFDNSLSRNSLACCCISTAVVVAMKVVFTGLLAYFIIEKQVRAYIVSPKIVHVYVINRYGQIWQRYAYLQHLR